MHSGLVIIDIESIAQAILLIHAAENMISTGAFNTIKILYQ